MLIVRFSTGPTLGVQLARRTTASRILTSVVILEWETDTVVFMICPPA